MPYIPKDQVDNLTGCYDGYDPSFQDTKEQLNYVITEFMVGYLKKHGKNDQNISDVIAAAQDAADEMKRRVLAPYEDAKRSDANNVDPYMGW